MIILLCYYNNFYLFIMTENETITTQISENLKTLFSYAESETDNELEEYCDMIYCFMNNLERYIEVYS